MTAWRERAACQDFPTSWWFPGPNPIDHLNNLNAKRICDGCTVKGHCLAYAEDYYNRYGQPLFGIYGGIDAKEIGSPFAPAYAVAFKTLDEPQRKVGGRPPYAEEIEHGTWKGYRQHIRRGHVLAPMCDACAVAAVKERAAGKKPRTPEQLEARRQKAQEKREAQRSPEATRRRLDQERTSWIGL